MLGQWDVDLDQAAFGGVATVDELDQVFRQGVRRVYPSAADPSPIGGIKSSDRRPDESERRGRMREQVVAELGSVHHEAYDRVQGDDAGGADQIVAEGLELSDHVAWPEDVENDPTTIDGVEGKLDPTFDHDTDEIARVALPHDPRTAWVPQDASHAIDSCAIPFVEGLEES